jgi:Mrp family chromosome partitioning ATPase
MNAKHSRRTGRPRLDASARDRLLAEIAKLDAPASIDIASIQGVAPAARESEINALTAALRDALRSSVETVDADPAPELEPDPEPKAATSPEPVQSRAPAAQEPPSTTKKPGETLANWALLPMLSVDSAMLERNLVITAKRTDPAHGAFDVLRTRLVQALAEKGWRRVAITSPTAGCGKSFTAINLAVTLSRYDQCRTILMDMDLRKPGLARYLGVRDAASTGDFLRGLIQAPDYFTRLRGDRLNIGANLALGLNGKVEDFAAELFPQQTTTDVLAAMEEQFHPEVILFDLPPALAQDDVIAFRPHFDCILMVVGGGITTAEEVREAQRRIGEDKPLLGIVLNKAEFDGDYAY